MTLYQCPLCKRLEASDAEAPPECDCPPQAKTLTTEGVLFSSNHAIMKEILSFRTTSTREYPLGA